MERRVDRKRYLDSAALGDALYARYGVISGSQSASGTLGAWIMALVWLDPTAARGIRETPPPRTEELDDGYCASLYRRAKNLLDARRWDEALPVFRHIHDLRWVNIPMYLDAAECFLRNEDVGESLKLLRELRRDLDGALGSLDLERAGRLFRAAGDRQEALASFQEARKRYRLGK
jgi:tetratricopeptide (TPR) repeat protein